MKYDKILIWKNEFYTNNNKTYYILKVDTLDKQNYMGNFFNELLKKNDKLFIGIDFEFNKIRKKDRDIALMQMNIENGTDIGNIFIIYPPDLTKENKNMLLKFITNKEYIKILHGGESLDIPYLFNQLLNDKELINNFCINFYDTKFLCDYYNLDNNINGKCSIYNLLLDQKIISKKKFNELEKIEEITGPIYLIYINIYKLDDNILKYSLYDVLYLPELLKKLLKNNWIYKNLIPEITCLINKHKRNIINEYYELEKMINLMNTYFIYDNNNKISLYDIWTIYDTELENTYINHIKSINFFKKFIKIILQFIVYYHINNNFTIFIKKGYSINNINWNKYWNIINNTNYLKKMIDYYYKLVKLFSL